MRSILLFVEDPGAANFVAGLPKVLAELGLKTTVVAAGPAATYGSPADLVSHGGHPDEALQLLDRLEPDVVVVGTAENPDTLGLELVRAARAGGLPTVGVVDGPDNASHRFRGRASSPFAYLPDRLLVADEWTKQQYVNLGVDEQVVVVTGHPHHDRVRTTGTSPAPRPPWDSNHHGGVPVVLFAAERSDGLASAQFERTREYTLHGRGVSPRRTDIVIEEFLDAVEAVSLEVFTVLRLHPKNDPDEFEAYRGAFGYISSVEPAIDVIRASDAVVGMTSMLLEEAVLLGVPTLSIVPRASERLLSTTVRLGLTPSAYTREAVWAEMSRLVTSPSLPSEADVAAALPNGGLRRAAAAIAEMVGRSPV